jgi:hypothetical protein
LDVPEQKLCFFFTVAEISRRLVIINKKRIHLNKGNHTLCNIQIVLYILYNFLKLRYFTAPANVSVFFAQLEARKFDTVETCG